MAEAIHWIKAAWEVYELPMEDFLDFVIEEGWQGTEIYLPGRPESSQEIRKLHEERGLYLIGQISSQGKTVEEHLRTLEKNYRHALECGARRICSHTGSDFFQIMKTKYYWKGERYLPAMMESPSVMKPIEDGHSSACRNAGSICAKCLRCGSRLISPTSSVSTKAT